MIFFFQKTYIVINWVFELVLGDGVLVDQHDGLIFLLVVILIIISMILKINTSCLSDELAITRNLLDLIWLTCITLNSIHKGSCGVEKIPSFYLFLVTILCLLDSTKFGSLQRFRWRLSSLLVYIHFCLRVRVARFWRLARRKFLVERLEPVRVLLETSPQEVSSMTSFASQSMLILYP